MELKSIAGGKMVSDFDDASVPPKFYTKAVNLDNGIIDGYVGNILGNTFCGLSLDGVNEVKGSCEDREDKLIYLLVYNSLGKHLLIELNSSTNTCEIIFQCLVDSETDIFKFTPDTEISSFSIIDGGDVDEYGNKTSKILSWTDNVTDVRYFNIGKSRRYSFPGTSTISFNETEELYQLTNENIKICDTIRYIKLPSGDWFRVKSVKDGVLILFGEPPIGDFTNVKWSYRDLVQYNETILIKAPPIYPVRTDFFTNDEYSVNNVRRDMFQFVSSFIYADNQTSVWGVTSEIAFPPDGSLYGTSDPKSNNGIRLTFDTGDRSVEKIKIAFRKLITSPNNYFEIIVLDKRELGIEDNSTYTYDFYNNANQRAVPFAEINNIDFDRVPLTAGCLDFLNNGSLAIGDPTDGYDLEPIDFDAFAIVPANYWGVPGLNILKPGIDAIKTGAARLKYAARYKVGVIYGDNYGRRTPVIPNKAVVNTPGFEDYGGKPVGIFWQIDSIPPVWATWYAIVATKNLTYKNTYYGIASKLEIKSTENTIIYAYINNIDNLNVVYGSDFVSYNYASGDRIKLHKLIASDGSTTDMHTTDAEILADTFINVSTTTTPDNKRVLKVKLPADFDLSSFTEDGDGNLTLNTVLFEAYTPKIESDFDNVYYHLGMVYQIANPGTAGRVHLAPNKNQIAGISGQAASGVIMGIDSFVRQRAMPKNDSEFPNSGGNTVLSALTGTDLLISGNGTTGYLSFVTDSTTDPGGAFGGVDYIHSGDNNVDVNLHYNLELSATGFATSATVSVEKYDGVNWGSIASKTYNPTSKTATYSNESIKVSVYLANGNRLRVSVKNGNGSPTNKVPSGAKMAVSFNGRDLLIEDFNFSDYFKSQIPNVGTPTVIDSNYRRVRRKATLLHTDPLIPETNINGLNRIFAGYSKDYDLTNGALKRLFSRGESMYAIHENNTIGIPIGTSIISSADGATQIGLSSALLNPAVTYRERYGLGVNTSCVVDTGVFLYMLDVANGCFVRLGNNGFDDIGKQSFFSEWIRNKCARYINSINKIKIGYDSSRKEVIIIFKAIDGEAPVTLSYSERLEGFNTFYSYSPEHMANMSSKLYSFVNGGAWVHGTGQYNTFYGVKYKTSFDLVFNNQYPDVKICRFIKVIGNNLYVPVAIMTDLGCETGMTRDMFLIDESSDAARGLLNNKIDGVYTSHVPMDINSDGGKFDGLPVRGKLVKVSMESDSTSGKDVVQGIYLGYEQW